MYENCKFLGGFLYFGECWEFFFLEVTIFEKFVDYTNYDGLFFGRISAEFRLIQPNFGWFRWNSAEIPPKFFKKNNRLKIWKILPNFSWNIRNSAELLILKSAIKEIQFELSPKGFYKL